MDVSGFNLLLDHHIDFFLHFGSDSCVASHFALHCFKWISYDESPYPLREVLHHPPIGGKSGKAKKVWLKLAATME